MNAAAEETYAGADEDGKNYLLCGQRNINFVCFEDAAFTALSAFRTRGRIGACAETTWPTSAAPWRSGRAQKSGTHHAVQTDWAKLSSHNIAQKLRGEGFFCLCANKAKHHFTETTKQISFLLCNARVLACFAVSSCCAKSVSGRQLRSRMEKLRVSCAALWDDPHPGHPRRVQQGRSVVRNDHKNSQLKTSSVSLSRSVYKTVYRTYYRTNRRCKRPGQWNKTIQTNLPQDIYFVLLNLYKIQLSFINEKHFVPEAFEIILSFDWSNLFQTGRYRRSRLIRTSFIPSLAEITHKHKPLICMLYIYVILHAEIKIKICLNGVVSSDWRWPTCITETRNII